MRSRRSRARGGRRRGRSLLWISLGLVGVGLAAALVSRRHPVFEDWDLDEAGSRHEPEDFEGFDPAEAPEGEALWVAGPAGNLYVRDGGENGDRGGLPMVFLHSLAGNGGQWALQLDHLRRHRRAVALDLRGHGESDPADDGDYTIAGMAHDVTAVVDQLGIRRFVLAGHSLGALVAIEYASRHPDRVAGLLLVDPNGDQSRVPREQIESYLAPLRLDPLAELELNFRQLVLGGDPDAARWVLEDLRLTHEDAVVGALESAAVYEPLPALARYPGPRLSVISEFNRLPYSLHKLLPDLPTQLLRGTGHWLMMDRPELFNQVVDEFLDEVEGRA
ncbi:MAG TPA: alpha/beta fold hydrolase [Thermoanaerobaculia bacterium]|nr:alpha/beta fold hydrolase [Thermoanaerobaculia bacterium]